MMDETSFRREADRALHTLKQSLIDAEEDGGFEVEENHGVLNVVFDEPKGKFVFTPNTPVRQIWISALSTSFKLEWNQTAHAFTFPKTGEEMKTLTERLVREQIDDSSLTLT